MSSYIRDDITEYKTIFSEGREIKVFVLGRMEEQESILPISEFKMMNKDCSTMKMSRFGGD